MRYDWEDCKVVVCGALGAVLIMAGLVLPQLSFAQFAVGDHVKTTAYLGVRATPQLFGTLLGRQAKGSEGVVLEGPVAANGYTWWRVDYDRTPDGWSAGEYLVSATEGTGTSPISVSPSSLSFTYSLGGAYPSPKSFSVANLTPAAVAWTVSSNASWLSTVPLEGSNTRAVEVRVNPSGLGVGSHTGTLSVVPTGIPAGARSVTVLLTVLSVPPPGTSTIPTVSISRPQQNSTVSGAVTVEAVASDDVGISRVEFYKGSELIGVASSSSTAPTITTPPANRTVAVGQTATFSVVAQGTAPLSYQWQRATLTAWQNIAGATLSSYTTPAATQSDSGAQFRVVVSNGVGSITSPAATLTVSTGGGPVLSVAPLSLFFNYVIGGAAPIAQNLSIANTGGGSLSWNLNVATVSGGNWLTVNPTSGLNGGTSAVSIQNLPQTPGTYSGIITANAGSAGIATTSVSLYVSSNNSSSSIRHVVGYYANWDDGHLPPSAVEWEGLTHLVHFKLDPDADIPPYYIIGDGVSRQRFEAQASELIQRAHARNPRVKVLLDLGGPSPRSAHFARIAANPTLLNSYVTNVLNYARSLGYDGVDVDWEQPWGHERQLFINLATALRAGLDQWSPRGELTFAVPSDISVDGGHGFDIPTLNSVADFVYMMNFDQSGYWNIPKNSGYNAPLYDPRPYIPGYVGGNIDKGVQSWKIRGLNMAKAALGLPFYGFKWNTITGPGQLPTGENYQNYIWYYNLLDNEAQQSTYHWDSVARVPWRSMVAGQLGATYNAFISYDDEQSIIEKVNYAKRQGLGGLMIFALGSGYRSNQPLGQRHPLLSAVRNALAGAGNLSSAAASGKVLGTASQSFSIIWNTATVANGTYVLTAKAYDAQGNTGVSLPVSVTVMNTSSSTAPTITTPPANRTVAVGQTATFSVVAQGTAPLSYQWQRATLTAWQNIAGATLSSYTTPAATQSDSGAQFRVVVSNGVGSITSPAATLTVSTGGGPDIGIGSRVKTTAYLSVRATPQLFGTLLGRQAKGSEGVVLEGPVAANGYTWWRVDYDRTPDGWSAGEYLVSATEGTGTSPISVAPTSLSFSSVVGGGTPASKVITVTNTTPAAVPWNITSNASWLSAVPTEGSQSATVSVGVTPDGLSAGTYSAVLKVIPNAFPEGIRNVAVTLTITTSSSTAPTITTPPANRTVAVGQTATFSVVAQGTAPLSYQWQRATLTAWQNIAGATLSSYTTPAATQSDSGAQFRVVVSNGVGSITSPAATLTVSTPPPQGATSSRVRVNGGDYYLLGFNYAWKDFGRDFGGTNAWGSQGVHLNPGAYRADMQDMRAKGIHVLRWWVFADGRAGIRFSADGTPTGIDPNFFADMDAAVQMARENGIFLVPSLFDFYLMRWPNYDNGVQMGGHSDLIRDPAKRAALITNVINPLLQHYANEPVILAWEVMNEPEWGISNLPQPSVNSELDAVTLPQFYSFAAAITNAVHTYTNSYATLGSASLKWVRVWTNAFADGRGYQRLNLDFHQPHYYEWMEPHCINDAELGNLCMSPLRQRYQDLGLDKPAVIGEAPSNASILNSIYQNGYAGVWPWMYAANAMDWTSWRNWEQAHLGEVNIPSL